MLIHVAIDVLVDVDSTYNILTRLSALRIVPPGQQGPIYLPIYEQNDHAIRVALPIVRATT